MEKQRITTAAKSCRRLLISILLVVLPAFSFAQTLTAAMIRELTINPAENQKMYAKEDLKFEVFIPYVKSSQVQIQSPSVVSEVSFKQIKKADDWENGGVKLEVWYYFGKKGDFQLPALPIVIQNRRRTIKFAPVTIIDNPADMLPRIVIQFSNGQTLYSDTARELIQVPVGKPISFTVNLQYAVQLIQFNYDIPKDSIFTQTKVFEITEIKYREKKYSDELIPVATFNWTGLVEGQHSMPPLKLQVTGYNGYRIDCVMPEFAVDFMPVEDTEQTAAFATAFDDVFDFSFEDEQAAIRARITLATCQKLAELRRNERNDLFAHAANKHLRQSFEEEYMLPATEDEFFMGILYISHLILLVMLVLLIFLLKKHYKNLTVIAASFFICAIALFTYSEVKKNETYAIFTGGKVSSIPEANAESYSEISAGNRVHITEKAGKWYYIELGETGGWCQSDKVLIIK